MITAVTLHENVPLTTTAAAEPELERAVWIDMLDPTDEERAAVASLHGEVLPPEADVGEIEATSRFCEDESSIRIQLNFLDHAGARMQNMHVAFSWAGGPLVSIHASPLVAGTLLLERIEAQPQLAGSGIKVLLGLLESKVDHLADVIEDTYTRLEVLSRRVLDDRDTDLEAGLVALAEIEARNGTIRINLIDTQRVVTSLLRSDKLRDGKDRLTDVLRDVDSLVTHSSFLLEEISFLSSTIMGLVNTAQNQIMKVLSVVAVVFLPPTLVASVYGMNFARMPELTWPVGYPLALFVMVTLAVAPYVYVKRRGWM